MLTDRGKWAEGESYGVLDYTTHPTDGKTYLCLQPVKSTSVGVLANDDYFVPVKLPDLEAA